MTNALTMGAGKGAAETTAATEPVRRPGPLPSKKLSLADAKVVLRTVPAADVLLGEIERLQRQKDNLLETVNSKQAKIDALMLEFCPGEMSAEQRAEWAKHQQPSHEPPQASKKLDELIEYMEACALIARNGADIHSRSKELRHHADMVTAVVEALRASHEPPVECPHCNELIDERDRAQDALQETHIALGGDGEWTGKLPPQPAPDSGDLHLDVPELASERMAELERLRAAQPPIDARVHPDTRLIDSLRMRSTLNDMAARADSAKVANDV